MKNPTRKSSLDPKSAERSAFGPTDTEHVDYDRDLGDPGQFPYTRGIYPEMYRRRLWTMRQYAGFGTAEESNERYRYLLDRGTTGLSVAFDLPTQIGLDSDHSLSEGEVGRVGVAIDSVDDMDRLFSGIPLDRVSTSMTINATAPILLAFYLIVARRRGIAWSQLKGTVQNDILKEYLARGTYIYPPEPSLRLIVDLMSFCSDQVPNWNTISISGYHIREAGATAVQEVAFTLANAETYLQAAVDASLNVDRVAPQFSFFFASHNDFLEEVAKFRAARRSWARLVTDRFSAVDPRSSTLRFHVQTAGSTLTAQQPGNNTVRVTLQALAAILGGAQSLHTNSRDEALALPTEESATLALRTQQIIAFESGVTATADPLGGSWYVEHMTDQICRGIDSYLETIRGLGGVLAALEKGFLQKEIQDSAYQEQKAQEEGTRVVVGVNRYTEEAPRAIPLLRIDPAVEEKQKVRLKHSRQARSQDQWERALNRIVSTARGRDNLMPAILAAADAGATVGEISDTLRQVFGEFQETVIL